MKYQSFSNKYKRICFIEGKDDFIFYRGFFHKLIKEFPNNVGYVICENKRNVLTLAEFVLSDKLWSHVRESIFIVDKDYDSEHLLKELYGEEVIKKVIILPCYSIENFYFNLVNLKILFLKIFKKEEVILNTFIEIMDDFYQKTMDYQILRMINTNYQYVYHIGNIVEGYIQNNQFILDDEFKRQVKKGISFIKRQYLDDYNYCYGYLSQSCKYIRGKDLAKLLEDYSEHIRLPFIKFNELLSYSEQLNITIMF